MHKLLKRCLYEFENLNFIHDLLMTNKTTKLIVYPSQNQWKHKQTTKKNKKNTCIKYLPSAFTVRIHLVTNVLSLVFIYSRYAQHIATHQLNPTQCFGLFATM